MKSRWIATAIALGLAACGHETGPVAPAATPAPTEAVVTINGVTLLRASAIEAQGSIRAAELVKQKKSSTFDRAPVNRNGGTLAVDGATLSVPQGALDETVHVTMQTGDARADGLWSYEFGPSGLHFERSATLTVEVSIADLLALGIDPDRLSVAYVSDPDHANWQVLGGAYDPVTQTISAPIDHFSRYALCIE